MALYSALAVMLCDNYARKTEGSAWEKINKDLQSASKNCPKFLFCVDIMVPAALNKSFYYNDDRRLTLSYAAISAVLSGMTEEDIGAEAFYIAQQALTLFSRQF